MNAKHYYTKTIQAIDLIEAYELDFCLGNAVKYISRAGRKGDAVEDLKKAIWYIERRIKYLTNDQTSTHDHQGVGTAGISAEVLEVLIGSGQVYSAGQV